MLNSDRPAFKTAFPYQDNVLGLPVTDLNRASDWYCKHFAMTEVARQGQPVPTVILERDGTRVFGSQSTAATLLRTGQQSWYLTFTHSKWSLNRLECGLP